MEVDMGALEAAIRGFIREARRRGLRVRAPLALKDAIIVEALSNGYGASSRIVMLKRRDGSVWFRLGRVGRRGVKSKKRGIRGKGAGRERRVLVSFRLPPGLVRGLAEESGRVGKSRTAIVEGLLERHLGRQVLKL